ncbi:MAG: hypothetical protein LBU42_04530 [Prevotellaceae bacterium]|jgi:hypothetical protein|nr:hypothetical protein [Prevotellaceae bacterium]
MKTIIFFLAMLASVAASAQVTHVEPVSADYMNQTVSFRVWWSSRDATHLSKVWVWVDYVKVNANNTTSGNTWTRAVVSAASPTASVLYDGNNRQGFWLQGNSGSYSATVTVKLNLTEPKFNWCAYASDYPPNAVINGSNYTLRGTPPFTINGYTLGEGVNIYSGDCISSITDATGCPGLFPLPPTVTSLTASTTTICNGSSVILTAQASGAASYSFDNGSSWQTTATKTVSPTITTTYTLKVRSSTGCISIDSKTTTVTVNQMATQNAIVNSCGCASGLTACNGYCRNLTSDNAICYNELEIRASCYAAESAPCTPTTGWNICYFNRDQASTYPAAALGLDYVWARLSSTSCGRYRCSASKCECLSRGTKYSAWWLECR